MAGSEAGITTQSAKCWGERYILRTVTIPVVGPVDGTWKELRDDLRAAWADATALSNWLMTEYYVRDVRRNDQVKLPPQPKTYLYPEATTRFPLVPSRTVAATDHAIAGKYRAARYKLIWTGSVRCRPTVIQHQRSYHPKPGEPPMATIVFPWCMSRCGEACDDGSCDCVAAETTVDNLRRSPDSSPAPLWVASCRCTVGEPTRPTTATEWPTVTAAAKT